MIRKAGWPVLTLAAVGAGCLFFATNKHELEPERVAVRSEGMTPESLRWCFDADDTKGHPLETVFYTLECTPHPTENEVDVVVRLYDAPAHGRSELHRTGERDTQNAEFDLVYRFTDPQTAPKSGTSYHISFCGRNLGTWKARADGALA